ncbi:hypothetical protein [Couchioplanes caeruleus]|uniref:Protein kinase domain-containing protein n=2 Tax=Couchioplanes caeruleus TaxID=56438 RepID=A0A1K0FB42_9ACTN|nr:hypothetical protein [Couchioplanes caeruleus]OJF10071.1 hypothetical protein BG844_34065 [Couchioplanes caeruleus subsp. caeruleus]ROP31372.1 hypothetical protein EDD30_4272 [Couchioplanes caeruleus]
MDPAAFAVDKSALRALTEIGKGGQGRVWATDSVRINQTWSAVYKEYDASVLAGVDVQLLATMVAFVPALDPASGRWLCEQAAWPAALVQDNGTVRGFLMRRLPADFEMLLPQRDGSCQRKPSGLQFLLNPDEYLAKMAIPIDDRKRLLLLRNLAETLERFHRLGIVVGDLSPNNLMFQLSPAPRCFFIDCDAMRLHGASVLRQAETPDWEVPGNEELGTAASDAYKFGLLAIRLFARDQSARDAWALNAVSPQLGRLAVRSQAVDPDHRPAPAEWIPVLDEAIRGGGARATNGFVHRVTPAAPSHPPPVAPSLRPSPAAVTLAPPPSGGTWLRRLLPALVIGLLLLCIVGVIASIANANDGKPVASGAPAATTVAARSAATTDSPTPEPDATAGIVTYDAVVARPEGARVVRMLAGYFDAVNSGDWDTALRSYDPAGIIDPGDPAQRRSFMRAMSTTEDRDAVLHALRPSGAETLAELTFTSTQQAGYGPRRDPAETCTRWEVTYRLTYSERFGYRILRARDAADSPC